MKALRNLLTLCLIFQLYGLEADAQSVIIKKSEAAINPSRQKLLLCPDGDYLVFSYPFPDNPSPLIISRFDPQSLSPRYINNLQEFTKQYFEAAGYGDGRLFVFTSNKEGIISKYELDDKKGLVLGTPLTLFNQPPKYGLSFSFGSSSNGQFHYFMASHYDIDKKTTAVQGAIMDHGMNQTGSFSYTIEAERNEGSDFNVIQADDGPLSIICVGAVSSGKAEYRPMSYTLVQVDTKGKVRPASMSGMPPGALKDFIWTSNDQHLNFTAFQMNNSKGKGFTHFITGSYDPIQKKCSDIRAFELNPLLKQPPYTTEEMQKGIPWDVTVLKTIPLSDGSKVMIFQRSNNTSYYSAPVSNTPGFQASAGTTIFHYRMNLYILKADKTNTPQWFQILRREQQEPDYPIGVGTVAIVDNHDNIHIFYYDHKKNVGPFDKRLFPVFPRDYDDTRLADVMFTPSGGVTKQLIEVPDPEFRLTPESAFTGQKNIFFLIAMKSLKHALKERMYNHSQYKLATVEVK